MTGEIASVYMILWDKILVTKCRSLGISLDLYDRYVDDETVVTRVIGKGWFFNKQSGVMEFSKARELEDMDKCDTERTARIIADVANSINDGIQVTVDWPEKNMDGRKPVLDLKVWVDRSQDIPRISYSFYKKEVASKFTILKRSAVSEGVKKQTLFQEGIRRLSHVATWLPWVEVVAHMNEWSNCMRISGYSQKER